MNLDRESLIADGFTGFRTFADLDLSQVPQSPGVYAVLAPDGFEPRFLAESAAGRFKGKDPSLSGAALYAQWVDGADVLYIGKAGTGKKVLPPDLVDATEARLHTDFLALHGRLPFANLVRARTTATPLFRYRPLPHR